MKREMYKTSLKLKTVDELVEIILRKDDKEREKNKQMNRLERKICSLKRSLDEATEEIAVCNKQYEDATSNAHRIELNRQLVTRQFNKALTQNTILRVLIALLGAVVIIELLIIMV